MTIGAYSIGAGGIGENAPSGESSPVLGTALLPVRVVVGALGAAGLPVQVAVVAPAVLAGSATAADGGSGAAAWGVVIEVDGIDVSDHVLGEVMVDAEEGAARVADFTLHREPGTVVAPSMQVSLHGPLPASSGNHMQRSS